jgi:hypothetical protein
MLCHDGIGGHGHYAVDTCIPLLLMFSTLVALTDLERHQVARPLRVLPVQPALVILAWDWNPLHS